MTLHERLNLRVKFLKQISRIQHSDGTSMLLMHNEFVSKLKGLKLHLKDGDVNNTANKYYDTPEAFL